MQPRNSGQQPKAADISKIIFFPPEMSLLSPRLRHMYLIETANLREAKTVKYSSLGVHTKLCDSRTRSRALEQIEVTLQ